MGKEIAENGFSSDSYRQFERKLQSNLLALSQLLQKKEFGRCRNDSLRFGAELEMYIVDQQGKPLPINQTLLDCAQDPLLTLELNRYNLEFNLKPHTLSERPFESTEQQILKQLSRLNQLAEPFSGRVVPIGILPTLKPCHLGSLFMTDRERYRVLVAQLLRNRGCDFSIHINGHNPLRMLMGDITLEGANTSFQVHYRVESEDYINTYNAFQLVTPLVLAMSANSPMLFGHQLWQETRIPLFKQSIDARVKDRYQWHEPARVGFGQGWLRQSPLEAFQQSAFLYPPLLPICSDEDPQQILAEGKTPELNELKLHQGTVWSWNRPVYDPADNGHLRIEMRVLPAGPTAIDMVANAAFYIGLAESYKDQMPDLLSAMPFSLAEYNFYRSAQYGLQAEIIWPDTFPSGCKQQPITQVIEQNISRAEEGLQAIGITSEEINKYLTVIVNRLSKQTTAAHWQIKTLDKYHQQTSKAKSLPLMLEEYIANSRSNRPVSEWE